MEYTNEVLEKMDNNRIYNIQYGNWYYSYSQELREQFLHKSEIIKKRGNRIKSCLDYWEWDKYNINKILDLQKVNRCGNRFCPNCRKLDLAKFIHKFSSIFKKLISEGYNPYLLTLTVPNCKGEDLSDTISKMNNNFNRFFKAYNQPIGRGLKGFKERSMFFEGALKVLEITYNKGNNTFHPHFHCMVFSYDYERINLEKRYKGSWSYKRKSYNMYSDMDLEIMKIWTMISKNISLYKKNYDLLMDKYNDLFICDFREMDQKGIYEVLKYTFKDTDISNYYVFKMLVEGIEKKRMRQGYGILQGLKCEDVEEGEKKALEEYLEFEETPENLLTYGIQSLITDYHNYKKISRYKCYEELKNIDD